ncbi:MAG TPA: DUF3189 family protein [Syntrophomonadaceae bacterium]|nr:DUF3189 family protein [Syntrophomonadaceae bacterium]
MIKKVVYFDYGGSHTSILAACIHCGKIPADEVPDGNTLMELPYLDKTSAEDFGKIKYIGTDESGNEIYALGTKASDSGPLLQDLAVLQGIDDEFEFIRTTPFVNPILRIGGFLSRSASLPFVGRPLLISGLKKAYPYISTFVEQNRIVLGGEMQ